MPRFDGFDRIEDKIRISAEKYSKENIEVQIHAGRHDGAEKVSITLDSLSLLPRCPHCGAKKINRAKKCRECGFRF